MLFDGIDAPIDPVILGRFFAGSSSCSSTARLIKSPSVRIQSGMISSVTCEFKSCGWPELSCDRNWLF